MLVGAVEISGIYSSYSQGIAADLTVSAVGTVFCAARRGGARRMVEGTSFGESLLMQISLTSDVWI